jgi:hypothetical protein
MVASIGFADDTIYTPLQAADILAHLTREWMLSGKVPPLLERLGTPGPEFILRFDGGELWDEVGIDRNWAMIEAAKDMP